MNRHLGRGLNAVRHRLGVEAKYHYEPLAVSLSPAEASATIGAIVKAGQPSMVARFGATELNAMLRRLEMRRPVAAHRKAWAFLRGECGPYWFDEGLSRQMLMWSGFFPPEPAELTRFGDLMLSDCELVDVLGSWMPGESMFAPLMPNVKVARLEDLEPYLHSEPWSAHLEGKRVLVVHPFESTILSQYANRRLLFHDSRVLPAFDLVTLKAVQSVAGNPVPYRSWFEALAWMSDRMEATEFDVALIGAGAYGFPLAAHAKRLGKVGIHLGGALQLLFGIRGRRWDERAEYRQFFNPYWKRPSPEESVEHQEQVEGGSCYW